MTPAEMVTEIDDYGFADVASARKYAMLNHALRHITGLQPWPFREASVTLTFAGGSATPSNTPAQLTQVIALTNPSTGAIMIPLRSEELQKRQATQLTLADAPIYYYFDAGTLKFWPQPLSTDTLTMRYLQQQATVSSTSVETDVLLPARYHWLAVYFAVAMLQAKDDDLQMAQFYMGLANDGLKEMQQDLWIRSQYDRPDTVLVLDPDDYDYYDA